MKPATVLFQADGMELSLTLTATSAGGAVTTTTRIVRNWRGDLTPAAGIVGGGRSEVPALSALAGDGSC